MTEVNIARMRDDVRRTGTSLVSLEDSFLSDQDFQELERLCQQVPYEFVEIGDADEPNHVHVGRFMTDVEAPEMDNRPHSDAVVDIVTARPVLDAQKSLLGADEIFVRRMQVNILSNDGFVGFHFDTDSNPDYEAAVIIQFGKDFTGGEYVTYPEDGRALEYRPTYGTVMVSDCSIPHEVNKVSSGKRISLVYFLARHGGNNRRAVATSGK